MAKQTFKTLCPKWHKKTIVEKKDPGLVKTKKLNLDDMACCVVGEAHKFSVYWTCEECSDAAMRIFNAVEKKAGRLEVGMRHWISTRYPDLGTFRQEVRKFLNHWNEEHESNSS